MRYNFKFLILEGNSLYKLMLYHVGECFIETRKVFDTW